MRAIDSAAVYVFISFGRAMNPTAPGRSFSRHSECSGNKRGAVLLSPSLFLSPSSTARPLNPTPTFTPFAFSPPSAPTTTALSSRFAIPLATSAPGRLADNALSNITRREVNNFKSYRGPGIRFAGIHVGDALERDEMEASYCDALLYYLAKIRDQRG